MATYRYIRASGVRKLAKENSKRCGADFLSELDRFVYETVCRCIKQFNGHRRTLDSLQVKLATKQIKTGGK